MSDQQRLFLTIAICLGIMLVWSQFFAPDPPPRPAEVGAPATTGPTAGAATPAPAAAAAAVPGAPVVEARPEVKTDVTVPEHFHAVFTSRGARLASFEFLHPQYVVTQPDKSKLPVQMVSPVLGDHLPLALSFREGPIALTGREDYTLVSSGGRKVHYRWDDPEGRATVEKIYELPESGYELGLTVRVTNRTGGSLDEKPALEVTAWADPEVGGGFFSIPNITEAIWRFAGEVEREVSTDLPTTYMDEVGYVEWAGWNDRYFLFAMKPPQQPGPGGQPPVAQVAAKQLDAGRFATMITLPLATIAAGGAVEHHFTLFIGPKDLDLLEGSGGGLEEAIDFWIVGVIARPLLWLLGFFHGLVGNWGLSILLLTLVVKGLLFPFTQKSFKSMRDMQKLKPKMDKLKEKHSADKERMNQELLNLYKTHKINPLSGCLPMVFQMPVWFALYRAIYGAVDLYQAPLALWITDLSAPDPYYVMPIALGAVTFVQQHLSPTAMDSAQAKMMKWMMPIMFSVFMVSLPAGLVLYIFINSLLTIVQQWYIKKQDA